MKTQFFLIKSIYLFFKARYASSKQMKNVKIYHCKQRKIEAYEYIRRYKNKNIQCSLIFSRTTLSFAFYFGGIDKYDAEK